LHECLQNGRRHAPFTAHLLDGLGDAIFCAVTAGQTFEFQGKIDQPVGSDAFLSN
jgi:hypothetical protein